MAGRPSSSEPSTEVWNNQALHPNLGWTPDAEGGEQDDSAPEESGEGLEGGYALAQMWQLESTDSWVFKAGLTARACTRSRTAPARSQMQCLLALALGQTYRPAL